MNWSTNKNLRALTTYLGRTDGRTDARHFHIPHSALRGRGTTKCKVEGKKLEYICSRHKNRQYAEELQTIFLVILLLKFEHILDSNKTALCLKLKHS